MTVYIEFLLFPVVLSFHFMSFRYVSFGIVSFNFHKLCFVSGFALSTVSNTVLFYFCFPYRLYISFLLKINCIARPQLHVHYAR